MKKNGLLLTWLIVLVCALATGLYCNRFIQQDDRTPPEITMTSAELEVSVKADESLLLQGVSAWDEVDGDVSAGMVVEGVSQITNEQTATITYAAFDHSGNVSKVSRTLKYTDYESPQFGQKHALIFSSNTSSDVLSFMTAEDKMDGDISNRIKGTLLSDVTSLNYPGIHQVEFRVTNSMGDTQRIVLPVEVYESGTYNATVELAEYLVYLKTSDVFKPEAYLENLIVGARAYSLKNQLSAGMEMPTISESTAEEIRTYINEFIDPALNTNRFVRIVNVDMVNNVRMDIPGVYSVTYTVTMDDDYVGRTRLNVVVEE